MLETLLTRTQRLARRISWGRGRGALTRRWSPPQDCVITIPPYFDHVQRAAMINAAAIAGLNVLSLVHENAAFAFK